VTTATGALADAASAAYGALNLPPSQAVDMILKARRPGAGSEGGAGGEGSEGSNGTEGGEGSGAATEGDSGTEMSGG